MKCNIPPTTGGAAVTRPHTAPHQKPSASRKILWIKRRYPQVEEQREGELEAMRRVVPWAGLRVEDYLFRWARTKDKGLFRRVRV